MAIADYLDRFAWHPAVQSAYSTLYGFGMNPYGSSPYQGGSGSSTPSSASAYPSSSGYADPYNPYATDPGTGRTSGGSGMRNVPGWAGRQGYTAAGLNELYYNPSYVLPDVIGKRAAMGPGGQMLANQPYDPRSLYMLTAGNKRSSMKAGPAGYANWLGQDYYPDLAGGQLPDFQKLMSGLEDPRKKSALGMQLAASTPAEQVNLYQQYLYDAAMASLGPDVASALIGMGDVTGMTMGNKALSMGPNQASNFNVMKRMTRGLGL